MDNSAFQYNITIPPFNSTNNNTNAVNLPNESLLTIVSQSSLGIIGFFANLSVIVTLSSTKKLRNKIINIYIINQACFLISFFILPENKVETTTKYKRFISDFGHNSGITN